MARKLGGAAFAPRENVVRVRVNDAEMRAITARAERSGKTISAYLRAAGLQRREPPRSHLVKELQQLNALLTQHASEHGRALNLDRVADSLARLMQCAISGEIS